MSKLIKPNGNITFITPSAIFDEGQQNTAYKVLKRGIKIVDYNANKYFNIGQKVATWNFSPSHNGDVIVIDSTKRNVKDLSWVCEEKNILVNSILNKVSYKTNNRKKMDLFNTDKKHGVENKLLTVKKNKQSDIEVYCNTKNKRTKYTDISNKPTIEKQLIIPYIGGWEEGCLITDIVTNKFFYVNKYKLNTITLTNMKQYIESKLISFCVLKFCEVKPGSQYNFLSRLAEVDFSKAWSDEDIYKEFKLTEEEINAVEKWYANWKK
jgi:hypothetical protein